MFFRLKKTAYICKPKRNINNKKKYILQNENQ